MNINNYKKIPVEYDGMYGKTIIMVNDKLWTWKNLAGKRQQSRINHQFYYINANQSHVIGPIRFIYFHRKITKKITYFSYTINGDTDSWDDSRYLFTSYKKAIEYLKLL